MNRGVMVGSALGDSFTTAVMVGSMVLDTFNDGNNSGVVVVTTFSAATGVDPVTKSSIMSQRRDSRLFY